MRYRPKNYASALVDAMSGNVGDKKIVANFLALLQKNGDVKKANQIIMLAEKLLLKKTGNHTIMLETARKVDAKELVKSFAKKGDVIEEKINPALIAGVKIIIDSEQQLDNSLLAKLNKL